MGSPGINGEIRENVILILREIRQVEKQLRHWLENRAKLLMQVGMMDDLIFVNGGLITK